MIEVTLPLIVLDVPTLKQESEDQIEEVDQVVEFKAYLGDENELEIEDVHINVICIILSATSDSNEWKRTSIFHNFIQSGERTYKLVVDGGSTMNIVSICYQETKS